MRILQVHSCSMWRVRGLVKEITKRSFEVHLLQLQVFSGDQQASQNTQENKRLESLESRATSLGGKLFTVHSLQA